MPLSDPSLLLERGALIEVFDGALTRATHGQGRLLIVEGGPGLGKTTMLEVAAAHAVTRGFRVLDASGRPLENDFSFGVALQLFESTAAAAEHDDALFKGAAALCRPLFAGDSTLHALPGDEGSFALLHGLFWLAANLADRRPLLVTVDDAHWVDHASLRFLLYLADRIADLPVVLMVATWREGAGATSDVLSHLRVKRSARLLDVEALSPRAVADLTRARFFADAGDEFCAAVHDATRGNPFLAIEYLKALDLEGVTATDASVAEVAAVSPSSVKRSAAARLATLPPNAKHIAAVLAVFGDATDLEAVVEMSALRPSEVAEALRTLRAADLAAGEESIQLTHPSIRTAMYDSLSSAQRDELHRRAARTLAARRAPCEHVAVHFLPTDPSGDDLVVSTLWAAATKAMAAGEPRSAVALLRRALAEPPLDDVRAELLVDLGLAEVAAADAGGLNRLQMAISRLRSRARRAEVYSQIGTTLRLYGQPAEAARAFADGLAIAPDARTELALRLETGFLAASNVAPMLHVDTGRLDAALESGRVDTTTDAGRAALAMLAFTRATAGETAATVGELARAALAASPSADERADLVPALAVLSWTEDYNGADRRFTDIIDLATTRGDIMTLGTASFRRAESRYHEGRLLEALEDGQHALAAEPHGWHLFAGEARAVVALCHLDRGESNRAALLLGGTAPEETIVPAALHAFALGRLHLVLDDAPSAAAMFSAAGEAFARSPTCCPALLPWRAGLALALNHLGDTRTARLHAAVEVEQARSFGVAGPLAGALCVAGLVDDRDTSRRLLDEAVDVARTSNARLARCRVLVEVGAAARRTGQRKLGVRLLREGLDLAEQCGARLVVARANQELEIAGTRAPRRSLTGVGALTPGELRVATMAAGNLTNREIAQRLFVTEKAVEWHLRNSFAKLGITSRRDLARALDEGTEPTATVV